MVNGLKEAKLASDKYRYGFHRDTENLIPIKNGDTLIILDNDLDTVSATIYLKHRNKLRKTIGWLNMWAWLELDGDNYFMIGSGGRGSGNLEDLNVFSKKNLKSVYSASGEPIYEDTVHSIAVFFAEGNKNDTFVIYNLNNNTREFFSAPMDNLCRCCSCWNLDKLTSDSLIISYKVDALNEKIVRYNRSSKKIK